MAAARSGSGSSSERVAYGKLPWAAPLAGLVAAVLNAVVYLVAAALGAMPQDLDINGQGPLTLGPVMSLLFVPALVGGVVFALLGRFTRRPVTIFRILAAVLLVLSFVTPFSIPAAPVGMIVALELMHVIAAVVIVGVLTTLGRAR